MPPRKPIFAAEKLTDNVMKYRIALVLIGLAVLTRLLPHPHNFTPIGAVGLFSAAIFGRRWLTLAVPLVALFSTDLYINNVVYSAFYDNFVWWGSTWVYAAFAAVTAIGYLLLHRRVGAGRVVLSSLTASAVFYAITNFGVWVGSGMYPHTADGLIACYVAALPFFGNTVLGDLLYSAALFGGYAWAVRRWVPLPSEDKVFSQTSR